MPPRMRQLICRLTCFLTLSLYVLLCVSISLSLSCSRTEPLSETGQFYIRIGFLLHSVYTPAQDLSLFCVLSSSSHLALRLEEGEKRQRASKTQRLCIAL